MPTCEDFTEEEYAILIGRYAESHIRSKNEIQFMCAFFGISVEALDKLHAKLRANKWIRGLSEEEVLQGEKTTRNHTEETGQTINEATNPDTEPSTDVFDALPYTNSQEKSQQLRETKDETNTRNPLVSAIFNWKHGMGSQAYNEFLDSYRELFVQIFSTKEVYVYGRD